MDRFRPAKDADVDAVVTMMRGYYEEDGYPFTGVEARDAVWRLLHDEHLGGLWVAEVEGDVVGYLAVTLGFSLEYRGRDAFIDELFISEEYRGLGLGREAMNIVEAYCLDAGVKALHLEVEHHRERAHALYEKIGFESHDSQLMTKLLDG